MVDVICNNRVRPAGWWTGPTRRSCLPTWNGSPARKLNQLPSRGQPAQHAGQAPMSALSRLKLRRVGHQDRVTDLLKAFSVEQVRR